ncbi:MAG: ROK family protein [Anaerolineae bacterium]|nr:ROK family protein [Anaerolineae bacterium]
MAEYYLTADIGGTQIRAALCDAEGRVYRRANDLTRAAEGQDAVIGRIKAALSQVMGDTPSEQIRGIGLAAPGPLDPKRGIIVFAPNLYGWHNVPLRQIIQDHFGFPTFLGNDANLAALAEHHFGAGRGVHNLIYITVSTGIGGGIIVDDRLLLGEHGFAAEIGHHTIDADGVRCNCGNIGCLETLASGPAIARMAREAIAAGEPSLLRDMTSEDPDQITGKLVYEAAVKGDALATHVLNRAGHYLGVGIVNLLHLFNPAMIIIGGSVAKAGDFLFEPMWETIRDRSHPIYWENLRIVPPELGDDVGLLGALSLVLDEQSADSTG